MKRYYQFFAILAVISALAITSNILVRRGPVHDATVANDIRQLQSQIDNYYLSQNQLPKDLSQIRADGNLAKRVGNYDYHVIDQDTYEICATFQTVHHSDNQGKWVGPDGTVDIANPDEHGKGRQCFSYTVLPVQDLYKR